MRFLKMKIDDKGIRESSGLEHLPHPQHGLPAVSHRSTEIRSAGSG